MDEQLTISTPEQVAFHYEAAGIGSRFVAALLDHLIIFGVLFLISCAAYMVGISSVLAGEEGAFALNWLRAALVIVFFLVFWGYFVIFEIVWQGRTPGKRAGRLRVLRSSGEPIGAGEATIRNLVRLVDFLPGFYGIGLISMFIDKEARRLGDFAAGTIVVRESEQIALNDVRVREPAALPYSPYVTTGAYTVAPSSNPFGAYLDTTAPPPTPDPLPGVSLQGVTPDDYRLMREVLERIRRGELQRERGRELSTRLAYGVAARMGHDFREWQSRGWEPYTFLESVLSAHEARGR